MQMSTALLEKLEFNFLPGKLRSSFSKMTLATCTYSSLWKKDGLVPSLISFVSLFIFLFLT